MLSDDMRPELGTYSAHVHSPNLDALAADGMVFERAYIMVSLCMVRLRSGFCSLLPPRSARV
jgi:arylsulfatase A-like enzyme